jgi:hypothetical protein
MFIYWVMFLIPTIAALSTIRCDKQVSDVGWVLLAIFFILIIGLRFEVGIDWFNNLLGFNRILEYSSLSETLSRTKFELGFGLFSWLAIQMGIGIWGVNLACSTIFILGLAIFCRRQPGQWIALSVAVPFLVIVVGMGYTRQAAAIGFLLLALVRLMDGYNLRFVFLLGLGALFHPTVLVFLPLGYLANRTTNFLSLRNFWLLFWLILVGGLLFYSLSLKYLNILQDYYFGIKMQSAGAVIRVVMCAIPATIFLLFRKRFNLNLVELRLWTWMSIACILLIPLVNVLPSSTAVDRVGWYLIPVQLFVYSRLPLLFRSGFSRQTLIVFFILLSASVQFVFLNFGHFAHGWLPYKFFLTGIPEVQRYQ